MEMEVAIIKIKDLDTERYHTINVLGSKGYFCAADRRFAANYVRGY